MQIEAPKGPPQPQKSDRHLTWNFQIKAKLAEIKLKM